MPLDWNGMVFVQRWRGAVARGFLVGIRRPRDRTYLDVRVQGADLTIGPAQHAVDIEVIDVGDIARERRLAILDRVSLVVEARVDGVEMTEHATKSHPIGSRSVSTTREPLRRGSRATGVVGESDGERSFLLDVGFPVVVTLPEGSSLPPASSGASLVVSSDLRGYLVTG